MLSEQKIEGRPNWTDQLLFINETDPEWKFMFSAFSDPLMENRSNGEVLEYMGTVVERYCGKIQKIRHEFRHRACPTDGQRKYWHIPASGDFCFRYAAGLIAA